MESSSGSDELKRRARRAAESLTAMGARAIAADSSEYPRAFGDLSDAPALLFARGRRLPDAALAVAVVGSRAASPYGLATAARLAADLARLGLTVVSGLARGVDAAAHRGALAAGGTTVAVLPSGLDRVTPTDHRDLAETIACEGTLVTELPCGGPRFRGEFVRRNRLIAALAAATVAVEAAPGSGALTTTEFARRLGRAVLAVPGDVDRPTARGTNGLLRGGARVCEDAEDVMRAVEEWRARHGGPTGDGAESVTGRLLAALGRGPRALESVATETGLSVPETLAGLLTLQWAGSVVPRAGQRWERVER